MLILFQLKFNVNFTIFSAEGGFNQNSLNNFEGIIKTIVMTRKRKKKIDSENPPQPKKYLCRECKNIVTFTYMTKKKAKTFNAEDAGVMPDRNGKMVMVEGSFLCSKCNVPKKKKKAEAAAKKTLKGKKYKKTNIPYSEKSRPKHNGDGGSNKFKKKGTGKKTTMKKTFGKQRQEQQQPKKSAIYGDVRRNDSMFSKKRTNRSFGNPRGYGNEGYRQRDNDRDNRRPSQQYHHQQPQRYPNKKKTTTAFRNDASDHGSKKGGNYAPQGYQRAHGYGNDHYNQRDNSRNNRRPSQHNNYADDGYYQPQQPRPYHGKKKTSGGGSKSKELSQNYVKKKKTSNTNKR